MSRVSQEVRDLVVTRAGNRCEYCLSQQEYVMGRLQVDHITPVVHGGSDELDNLSLACELCNQYKWSHTTGTDPASGEVVPLFNPRQQEWWTHFAWDASGTEIAGQTPCGRATINVLQLNNALAVAVRRNWVKAGWHPPSPYT